MSEQCEENPILARARTAIENGEAVNRVSALVARIEELEAAIERVRELCEQTTVSVSIGCRCYTDECSGTCGAGRPLSWHLNPAAVLAALEGDSDE
jgi:hypothetical protein